MVGGAALDRRQRQVANRPGVHSLVTLLASRPQRIRTRNDIYARRIATLGETITPMMVCYVASRGAARVR